MDEILLDPAFRRPARAAYAALAPADQEAVDLLVERLRRNPWPDGRTTFRFPSEVLERFILDNDEWAIIYRLVQPWVLEIWSIARSDPDWRRRMHY